MTVGVPVIPDGVSVAVDTGRSRKPRRRVIQVTQFDTSTMLLSSVLGRCTNALALMFPASGSQTAGAGGRRRVSPQRGGVVVDASGTVPDRHQFGRNRGRPLAGTRTRHRSLEHQCRIPFRFIPMCATVGGVTIFAGSGLSCAVRAVTRAICDEVNANH
ncbi:hypothetical protein RHA1_ro02709 [Rhodococcus jostii RHA1]|uniref:Uncharacterized protein n=1 Tax=Rhodococcus jostii (strain RHA1) TaxID=101510 RepID=Q0SD72_RHOJR|nr:hypothetical protein RHA1_ro02709 [Rhodococcus jostii RHA1]